MSGGAQWKAVAHLRSGIGHDALRDLLRRAIVLRDASQRATKDTETELAGMEAVEAAARAALDRFHGLDEERAAARTRAIRTGQPVTDDPAITEKLAAREVARVYLVDASRAVNAVKAEVALAQLALGDRQAEVEGLAAAVTAAEIERLADRMEETEKAAAELRAVVGAVAGSFVGHGFAQPFPIPTSERTKTLLGTPPLNARPRSDVPAYRNEDARTRAAFMAHAAALLLDADAPLAAALPA